MRPREQILVVDDDPSIRSILATVLDEEGYDVHQAVNGADALLELVSLVPCVIILDLNMPVMDGPTFYRQMRAGGRSTPVVIVSAMGAVRIAHELGATAGLNKPFDIDHLVSTVAEAAHPAGD
jgi:CheY-like chemotaxis protein